MASFVSLPSDRLIPISSQYSSSTCTAHNALEPSLFGICFGQKYLSWRKEVRIVAIVRCRRDMPKLARGTIVGSRP